MIHGQGYTHDQWIRLGLTETADEWISQGLAEPFIIVFPRDEIWKPPSQDPFGEAFLNELMPLIEATYFTAETQSGRAIGGLSRGGAWEALFGGGAV